MGPGEPRTQWCVEVVQVVRGLGVDGADDEDETEDRKQMDYNSRAREAGVEIDIEVHVTVKGRKVNASIRARV